jgi:hypothetical protein
LHFSETRGGLITHGTALHSSAAFFNTFIAFNTFSYVLLKAPATLILNYLPLLCIMSLPVGGRAAGAARSADDAAAESEEVASKVLGPEALRSLPPAALDEVLIQQPRHSDRECQNIHQKRP